MTSIDVMSIPSSIKEKLKKVGITRIEQLVGMSKETLMYLGLSETEALKAIKTSWYYYEPELIPASELKEEVEYLETPLNALNQILGGGWKVGTVNELFGPFASGKSSFLFTQAVITASKGFNVIFIDTEKTLEQKRLIKIAEARGISPEVLKNIKVVRAPSSNELLLVIAKLWEIIQRMENVKLIEIDSLTSPFRADYVGLEHLVERQQKLNYLLRQLMRMAEIYKLVVLFSNQVVALPGTPARWGPIGGHIVAHTSFCRIKLSKSEKKRVRVGQIVDHPSVPEKVFMFKITDAGVEDVELKE